MPIFGTKEIEVLTVRNERLSANVKRLEEQLDDCAKQRDAALKLAEQAKQERDSAQAEAKAAKESLAEFEERLKTSIAKLGGLLVVDGTHWIDPESVWEMSVEDGVLTINGRPVLKGSKERLLAMAKQIAAARTTPAN